MSENENKPVLSLKKITEGPLFTLSKSPLGYIEKGRIFKLVFNILCILMIAATIVYPFEILFKVISSGYFNFGLRYSLAFIFTWLGFLAAGWLGFHLWRDKRKKSENIAAQDFIAIPFFAEIIKTFGEWIGIMYSIIGAIGGLFSLIFLGRYGGALLFTMLSFGSGSDPVIGLVGAIPFVGGMLSELIYGAGFTIILLGPVVGCIIVLITRLMSESLRVLAAIANNTKK